MTFAALLLVGGESRRMGRDKATMEFEGEPLWQRQLRLLRALRPEKIFVSARSAVLWVPSDVELLLDDPPSRGPLSGLAKTLGRIGTTHLLVLAVDMPFMTGNEVRNLLELATEGCGVVPIINERAEPLVAIYPADAAHDFRAALAARDFSLQLIVRKFAAAGKVRLWPVPESDEHFYQNWNRPADLKEGRFPNRPPRDPGGLETAGP